MSDDDLEDKKFDFEREKWGDEKVFRDKELKIKEKDQSASRWTNPLVIGILTVAIAGILNLLLAYENGRLQRQADDQKAAAIRNLEEAKSDNEMILQMIKTGDIDKAVANLKFLISARLIRDPDRVKNIQTFLADRTPGSGPVLPATGSSRLSFDEKASIAADLQHTMIIYVDRYSAYLETLGSPPLNIKLNIDTYDYDSGNVVGFFRGNTLSVRRNLAEDPFVLLREYSHYALAVISHGNSIAPDQTEIESALADYFPHSFLQINPDQTAPSLADKSFFDDVTLRRERVGHSLGNGPQLIAAGHVWAGAFWQCRKRLGRTIVDKILFGALQGFGQSSDKVEQFRSDVLAGEKDTDCFRTEFLKRNLMNL
jgi:hypothetical protein